LYRYFFFSCNGQSPKKIQTIVAPEAFAKKIKAFSINPYYKLLNQESCEIIKSSGFNIYTWTVNTPEDLIFVKSLPVDGIISDFPDRI
jgi:glycerophosphoryl diester phosphodiesterase